MSKKIPFTNNITTNYNNFNSKLFRTILPILLIVVFTAGCSKENTDPTPDAALSPTEVSTEAALNAHVVSPAPVNLRTAGNFTILSETGISTTGVTLIRGDIGVSPIAATAITGFGLIMDAGNQFSHTPIVVGKVYGPNYAPPTPSKMTTAVSDMKTAFTTANGLTYPAPIVQKYAGDISGRTLPAGLYKWSTGVLVTNVGVTLRGGPNDVWVFQIAQNLTVNNGAIITLAGGAQAKNIFWVVSGKATIGTGVNFSGNVLSKTLISLNTGAKVTGKLLAQTAVTLIASSVHP
ncbi:MAG TPA: ice-binding family protein [Mucilaginibacter sp.]|nr:ice-binding family protein [Mucilaginibacter sp.]